MDITDVLALLGGEKAGPDTSWVNMAATTQNSCHNYKMTGTSTCDTSLNDITLYMDIPAFEPVGYLRFDKGFEDGNNEEVITKTRIEPEVKFAIYGDETIFNLINQISIHEVKKFTRLDGTAIEAVVKNIKPTSSPFDAILRIEVTMTFVDAAIERSICCGSYYDDAPFNECDGTGETGDPNADPVCVDYEVVITLVPGTPDQLTAATSGGGGGTETFQWYFNGAPFGTGTTVIPVLPGVYRVDARKGNCTHTQSYTYNIPCTGFEVTIQDLFGNGTLLVASANLISDIQWQELIAAVWTDIAGETDIVFQPDHDGEYRAEATAGECVAVSTSIVADIGSDCTGLYTLGLTNVAGTLTSAITGYAGAGTPTYQWFVDTGTGFVLLGAQTGPTIVDAPAGYYKLVVTLDGCPQEIGLLVQCIYTEDSDCAPDDSEWSQTFIGDGVTLAFNVTNFLLPDDAHIGEVEITATLLVTLNGNVLYYAAVPAGGTQYTIDYPNQEVEFPAGFAPGVGDVIIVRKLRWVKT